VLDKEHSLLQKYTSLARNCPVELPQEGGDPHNSHHRTKFFFLHKSQGHTVTAIMESLSLNKSETLLVYYKGRYVYGSMSGLVTFKIIYGFSLNLV
jgi:hypothetical protein